MRLNIIGNGFDLYHGLPTSYYYFGCFLASKYPDFYAEMSNMYGFICYKRIGHDDVDFVVSDMFWKTFEEQLGYLDSCWMENSLMDDLGLECDDPIDLDIPEVINSRVIKDKFCEWICHRGRFSVDLPQGTVLCVLFLNKKDTSASHYTDHL